MIKKILNNLLFLPKFFPNFSLKSGLRPFFGIPRRNFGGPHLRTKKLIGKFGNYFFSPNIIYAQSWWTSNELNDAKKYSYKNNVPIIFNQNGWYYSGWYEGNWKKKNNTIIDIQKKSKLVIYQSNFCKKTSLKLNNYIKKNSIILHNPPLILGNKNKVNSNFFNILLTGVFGRESEHILMPALKAINLINQKNMASFKFKLNIYGIFKDDAKSSKWFHRYSKIYNILKKKNLVIFKGKYEHENLHKILLNTNLAIHIKYKDPCPNAVIEKLKYQIPHIFSNSGGTPELIRKAGYSIKVADVWNKMIEVDYRNLANKIILAQKNEKELNKLTIKQSKKFSLRNYIFLHQKIFKDFLKN